MYVLYRMSTKPQRFNLYCIKLTNDEDPVGCCGNLDIFTKKSRFSWRDRNIGFIYREFSERLFDEKEKSKD